MNNEETMTNGFARIVLVQLNTDKQLNVREHEAIRVAIKALEQQTCTREDFIQYAKEHYGIDIEFKDSDKPDTFNGLFGVEVYEDAVSRNLIIQTLNKMDRYVADELTLCDTDKKFPKNEVFIVDDVYEEIVEQLPSVNPQPICEEREKGECPYYAG